MYFYEAIWNILLKKKLLQLKMLKGATWNIFEAVERTGSWLRSEAPSLN